MECTTYKDYLQITLREVSKGFLIWAVNAGGVPPAIDQIT